VVAADDGARTAAEQAHRLFICAADLAPGRDPLIRALLSAGRFAATCQERDRAGGSAVLAQSRLRELNKIGMALMSERDPDALLGMILTQARRLTRSDAGSLYLVESVEAGEGGARDGDGGASDGAGAERLHFLRAQNDSLPDLPSPDFTLPISPESIAGFVASTGQTLKLDDAYEIPESATYSFNRGFDETHGYRAKSMLVVPMIDHRDRVVGVLQLINRKREVQATIRSEEDATRWVEPYSPEDVETVQSLAGQAAVSIENGQLYQDIENLFDGFIKAAVTAIDRRDPTTSGHSVRVTELTVDTARIMHEKTDGPFADVRFTDEEMKQLRYAGLLHDFGKVGVREEVLVKQKKLLPVLEARLEARFEIIRKTLEADAAIAKAEALRGKDDPEAVDQIEAQLEADLADLQRALETIREANIPRVLEGETAEELLEIGKRSYLNSAGEPAPWLTEEELHYLSIKRGNLDPDERKQIESHVIHSYDFLLEIPWTDDLGRIAEIVRGHHEKLNGTGYPDGVGADSLSIETRIMTVCDIFDALTASDRPYKKAMPVEKALQILRWEAEEGALDSDIVELFIESEVYQKVLGVDWREL